MSLKYNPKLVGNAQHLRKNMTDEEKMLWYQFLKLLPMTVNRQKNIGNFIVDFIFAVKIQLLRLTEDSIIPRSTKPRTLNAMPSLQALV